MAFFSRKIFNKKTAAVFYMYHIVMLENKFCLCYINTKDLLEWIKEVQHKVNKKNLLEEKKKWSNYIQQPNFFSDSELLLNYPEILILQVNNKEHQTFLAKTYKLKYQLYCQEIWQERKNIIIVTKEQWKKLENNQKAIVLLKDQKSIEQQLNQFFN